MSKQLFESNRRGLAAYMLKERYESLADRLTLYTPFTPCEKDEFWKRLVATL